MKRTVTIVKKWMPSSEWERVGGGDSSVVKIAMSKYEMVKISKVLIGGYVEDGESISFYGGRYFPSVTKYAFEYGISRGVTIDDLIDPS